jgi:glycogen synthase
MNAMDPMGTWAGAGLSVTDVLQRKEAAKLQLQQRFGMTIGADYQLAVFMGRLTHQKGVDVIAEVN